MRALALEHLRPDPIGIFGEVLAERGIEVHPIRLDAGEPLPDWRSYDLIVAMGAGVSVWQEDEFPWIAAEKRTVHDAVLAGVPYFGVCFGAQLLADVFGARSFAGPEPEIGVNQMFLTAAARHDPVFRGFPPDLEVCEWHSNHFSLPSAAVRLARSPRYENQAVRYGRVAYGLQCHLEPSLADIRAWLADFPESAVTFEARHGPGSVERLLADYAAFVPFLQETARQVFGRWLENALALGRLRAAALAMRGQPRQPSEEFGGLIGREADLARIDAVVSRAREGGSAVLAICGEPGIGKTALLDAAAARARGLRVLRAGGDESSQEVPLSTLADICRPLAGWSARLPPRRAAAVAAILGSEDSGGGQDRFAVYAGALDLLVEAAEETPLLVLVDDAHLLDDASSEALAFVAGRLGVDGIALLIATEAEDAPGEEVRLAGLAAEDARAVLEARWGDALAPAPADAVVAVAAGNPLALVEIPFDLTPDQRAGRDAVGDSLAPSAEWAFLRRLGRLPVAVRQALLVAALARAEDQEAIAQACATLGVDASTLGAAESAGLVRSDHGSVRFTHPLARTAVAYSALRDDRRAAHAALADALTGDPRVWHLARAAAGPDEAIADDLAAIAARAGGQGAFASGANAAELAARLTPDDARRAERLVHAGGWAHLAGHVNAALDHLAAALRSNPAEAVRREVVHLRGRITARSGSAAAARDQLVAEAERLEQEDPVMAAQMLADAVLPALRAGGPADAVRVAREAERLARGRGGAVEESATVMLGTALVFAGSYAEGATLLDRALDTHDAGDLQLSSYLGAGLALAGRYSAARRVLSGVVDTARVDGAVSVLPYALVRLAHVQIETGAWRAAEAALQEAARLAGETGQVADRGLALGTLAWLEAARGDSSGSRAHVEEALELASRLGGGSRLDRAATAPALAELGRGRPDAAIPSLEDACRLQDEQGWSDAARTPHRRPELVEAYALAGRVDDARESLARFQEEAERAGRPSALAAAARCRGLLAGEDEFDAAFEEALATDEDAEPFERARTELLYGARLTAAARLKEAQQPLARALAAFERLGAAPWADRARQGIALAGGEIPPSRLSPAERLTARELDVALAAVEGGSARDIGARLFLGPRTVRVALASAAVKLGLDSPAEIGKNAALFRSAEAARRETQEIRRP